MMAYVIVRANRPLIDLICQFQMALLALRLHAHTDKWCRLGRKEKAEESAARLGSDRIDLDCCLLSVDRRSRTSPFLRPFLSNFLSQLLQIAGRSNPQKGDVSPHGEL